MIKSKKELSLDEAILSKFEGKALEAARLLISDPEIKCLQDYANTVSIKRLHYNDHGPVHMRKVVLNSQVLLELLHEAGVKLSLENEEIGNYEDSRIAVLMAAFLHDIGMTVGRDRHEISSVILALPIINRILEQLYPENLFIRTALRSLIMEGIMGHMGTQRVHSLEAGVILIADGCDMEQGRARIPMMLATSSQIGDIHKYSSSAIETVSIKKGNRKPIRIEITMKETAGFFQVEDVLYPKIDSSPVKGYIELFAGITGEKMKCYL